MDNWIKENRENLIFGAIVAAIIAVVLVVMSASGYGFWLTKVGEFLVKTFFFIVWIVILLVTGVFGYFSRTGADALDEFLGEDAVSSGMKISLIMVIGAVLSVVYPFFMEWVIKVPQFFNFYQFFGNPANLIESPLSQWAWIAGAFVIYFVGWMIRNMVVDLT